MPLHIRRLIFSSFQAGRKKSITAKRIRWLKHPLHNSYAERRYYGTSRNWTSSWFIVHPEDSPTSIETLAHRSSSWFSINLITKEPGHRVEVNKDSNARLPVPEQLPVPHGHMEALHELKDVQVFGLWESCGVSRICICVPLLRELSDRARVSWLTRCGGTRRTVGEADLFFGQPAGKLMPQRIPLRSRDNCQGFFCSSLLLSWSPQTTKADQSCI